MINPLPVGAALAALLLLAGCATTTDGKPVGGSVGPSSSGGATGFPSSVTVPSPGGSGSGGSIPAQASAVGQAQSALTALPPGTDVADAVRVALGLPKVK